MIYFIIYIFAISFQVSGALQLLISFVSTKRDDIIRRFIGKGLLFRDNNTKKIEYDKSAYKYEYKTAYLNKCSFIYIFIGYLIGVWGIVDNTQRLWAFIFIIILTTLILFITNFVISLYLNKSKNINREITNNDLERLHLEPDIENISNKEILNMLN